MIGPSRAGLALAAGLFAMQAAAAEVTPERLLHAADEPQNWLMNLGGYDGARYSRLDAVNRETVGGLEMAWSRALGGLVEGGGNYAAALPLSPLVEDGFIYIVDGSGRLSKLDARHEGVPVWESGAGQQNLDAWLEASRGIAFWRDFVIVGSADGRLHWIDKATGALVRSAQVGDPLEGYTIAAAPLVVGDTVIVGGGGGARGARGRIDAVDARTGAILWTRWSVPAPGEPGGETWPAGDGWRLGGGSFAQTGVYDPETGLTIWGAGHPFPRFDAAERAGDNLYTNSALALDAASGALRWHFQYTPGDVNGFSEVGSHMLAPTPGGSSVVHFGNNGFFYALDAAGGGFRHAAPYGQGIDWTAGLDADGRPLEYRDDAAQQVYLGRETWEAVPGCPNVLSTPAFAATLSARTGLAYGAGAEGCAPGLVPVRTPTARGWYGGYYAGAVDAIGALAAVDPATGAVAATRVFEYPLHAGALSTAGGLVFTTTADGTLHALNDETLETIWSQHFATLAPVPPITFAVDGRQHVAVVVGGNALSGGLSDRPTGMSITEALYVLLVLRLPE